MYILHHGRRNCLRKAGVHTAHWKEELSRKSMMPRRRKNDLRKTGADNALEKKEQPEKDWLS